MKEIIDDLMKNQEARISVGPNWAVWDGKEYVVYSKPYGAKKTRVLYRGEADHHFINALVYLQ